MNINTNYTPKNTKNQTHGPTGLCSAFAKYIYTALRYSSPALEHEKVVYIEHNSERNMEICTPLSPHVPFAAFIILVLQMPACQHLNKLVNCIQHDIDIIHEILTCYTFHLNQPSPVHSKFKRICRRSLNSNVVTIYRTDDVITSKGWQVIFTDFQ